MSYKGIDISNNNGYVNITNLKSNGYQFIIAKATEGTTFVDKFYQNFIQQSKTLNLLTGAYHFARFKDVDSAINEANFFKSIALQENPDFLVLDLEYEGAEGNLTEATNAFMNEISKAGKPVLLYSYPSFLKEHLNSVVQKFYLWIAHYNVSQPDIWCWNNYSIWQYSENENGFDANVMTDEFWNIVVNHNPVKEEKIDMGTIIVYGNEVDQRYAESLADAMNAPTINGDRLFDYSKYSTVICVGGAGKLPWTSYATKIIAGNNRIETEQMVLDFIKNGCK